MTLHTFLHIYIILEGSRSFKNSISKLRCRPPVMINYTKSVGMNTKSKTLTAKSNCMIMDQVKHAYNPILDDKVDKVTPTAEMTNLHQ